MDLSKLTRNELVLKLHEIDEFFDPCEREKMECFQIAGIMTDLAVVEAHLQRARAANRAISNLLELRNENMMLFALLVRQGQLQAEAEAKANAPAAA